MAVSRPLLLALVGVLLAAASLFAARGARETSADQPAAVPTPAPVSTPDAAKVTPAPPRGEGLEALPAPKPLKSGRISMKLTQVGGSEPGTVDLTARFQSQGLAAAPKFDVAVVNRQRGRVQRFGAVSSGANGFLTIDAAAYQLPEGAWGELSAMREKIASFDKGGAAIRGPLEIDYTKWLTNVNGSAGPVVDGAETIRITGKVDARKAEKSIAELNSSTGRRPGESSDPSDELLRSRLVLLVGAEDGIVRRARMQGAVREDGVPGRLRMTIDVEDVNKPQSIEAPSNVASGSPATEPKETRDAAIAALAVPLIGIDLHGQAAARAAGFDVNDPGTDPEKKASGRAGLPDKVARALDKRQVVVLFFGQRGADDRATADAVASVRGQRGVSVFRDDITRLAKYRAVTGGLGVAQAPATVVIGADRQAQLLEGFVDEGTLRQLVVDAR